MVELVDGNFPKRGDGQRAAEYIRNRRPQIKIASFSSENQTYGDIHIDKGQTSEETRAAIKAI